MLLQEFFEGLPYSQGVPVSKNSLLIMNEYADDTTTIIITYVDDPITQVWYKEYRIY